MESTFFKNNRQKLVQGMQDHSLLVMYAGSAPHMSADAMYEFIPNRNFYYLTGINEQHLVLLITKQGDKVEETLFIEKADPIMEKWDGKKIDNEEAKVRSGVTSIKYLESFKSQFEALNRAHHFKHLYLDLEVRDFEQAFKPAQQLAADVRVAYPYIQIENVYHTLSDMRRFKTPEEIAEIKNAIEITRLGIENMWQHARPDIMEYELEAHFDFTLKSNGIKHHAFHPIIAGGKNATVLHYELNNNKVQDGELVIIDLGAQYNYYNADISRTFPVNGTFTERQKDIYNLVLKANEAVIRAIKPGLPHAELNEITKRVLADGLKELGVIQDDSELIEYYYHGVSHYLGLDTHDVGSYAGVVLQPGMVLTVEPGLYIADESIGVRIEDDVLVTEDGYEVLSKDILKTVDEIEAFMKR